MRTLHRKASEARRRKSRGSVMLESALIFVVFFFLLVGTFDFGQFLFIHQALVERARWAIRWGLANDGTTDQIRNMMIYGQTSAGSNGYFGLDSSMVSVTQTGSGTWDYRYNISVSNYPYKMLSPYIAGTYTGPNINVMVPLGLFD